MSKGIITSVTASFLFAVMYYYTSLLTPLDGEEVFGWRMLLTLPCVTLFMLFTRDWPLVTGLLARVRRNPLLLLGLLGTSSLMGVQLWLFLWAPLHGRSLKSRWLLSVAVDHGPDRPPGLWRAPVAPAETGGSLCDDRRRP